MALTEITYTNKETLNEQPSIADKNKVKADDMNEIKSVVNTNAGKVGDLTDLDTTIKTSVVAAINEFVPTVIYNNPTGAIADTLSDSVENYSYIDIVFGRTDYPATARLYKGFYTNSVMSYTYKLSTLLRHYTCMITLSGTSFSESNGWFLNINGTTNAEASSLTGLNVYKIIGYK